MESEVLLLLILFSVKHTVGDFILQSTRMVIGKGKQGWDFIGGLSAHCFVHVFLSFLIILLFLDLKFIWFLAIEFLAHFIIDRLKSGPKYCGRFTMTEHPQVFWAFFGIDQLLHQLTYILFIFSVSAN